MIDRIRTGVESKLRKEQAGFRPGIIEQSIEWQSSLYVNFIDFEKMFDSVHRDSLWLIMRSYGIPPKIIGMAKTLYDDYECAVMDGQDTTEWFKIKTATFKEQGWHSRLVRGLGARGLEFDSRISHPCFDFFPFRVAK